jgi:hypothetical protein
MKIFAKPRDTFCYFVTSFACSSSSLLVTHNEILWILNSSWSVACDWTYSRNGTVCLINSLATPCEVTFCDCRICRMASLSWIKELKIIFLDWPAFSASAFAVRDRHLFSSCKLHLIFKNAAYNNSHSLYFCQPLLSFASLQSYPGYSHVKEIFLSVDASSFL